MAATRWTDPANWTYANCSDNTKQPLISHLWETWKEAAEEHVAFTEVSHSGGFSAANTFPDFIGNLINFGANNPRNSVRIKNAVYPEDAVETSTINSSGTFTGSSDAPDSLTLSQLLTGPLGYPSGVLLSETETDLGEQNALFRTPWFVQWFEVMDYPEFYQRIIGSSSNYLTNVEEQLVDIDIDYEFNGTTFISCTAFLITPLANSTPVDIYVANDLPETAPLATLQQVRDYAADLLEANSTTWATPPNLVQTVFASIRINDGTAGPNTVYRVRVKNSRWRFKVKDIFRATSPDKFTPIVKWNGFYDEDSNNYDFGTGETDQEMQFITLTKDGSDFYYLDLVDSGGGAFPDYKSFGVPTGGPGTATSAFTERQSFNTISASGIGSPAIMIAPNQSDGTAFEFYTP